jgi:hypothetical protein
MSPTFGACKTAAGLRFRHAACEHEERVTFSARGTLVWLGMVVSGLALGAYVFAVWPDTETRLVPLPYGEAMPKTPLPTEKSQAVRVRSSADGPLSAVPQPVDAN